MWQQVPSRLLVSCPIYGPLSKPGHISRLGAGALLLSTGCQLAMLALLSQASQAATGQAVLAGAPLWHPQALAGFVGVSGAYDLEGLAQHLHKRGLYKNLLDTIMSIDGQVRQGTVVGSGQSVSDDNARMQTGAA